MPKDFESDSMLRVLQQIQQLMEQLDVNSLKGLQEPEASPLPQGGEEGGEGLEEQVDGQEGGMEEDPDSDKAKLLALKRHENGG